MTSQTSTAMKANWRFFPTNKIRHYQKKRLLYKEAFFCLRPEIADLNYSALNLKYPFAMVSSSKPIFGII